MRLLYLDEYFVNKINFRDDLDYKNLKRMFKHTLFARNDALISANCARDDPSCLFGMYQENDSTSESPSKS